MYPTQATSPWTDELTAQLRTLANGALTAKVIADRLGMTRGQVMGKLDRLGLLGDKRLSGQRAPAKPKPPRRTRRKKPMTDRTPTPTHKRMPTYAMARPPSPPVSVDPLPSLGLTLMQLTAHNCRWPHGDGQPYWDFCGHLTQAGHPYCAAHVRLAGGR